MSNGDDTCRDSAAGHSTAGLPGQARYTKHATNPAAGSLQSPEPPRPCRPLQAAVAPMGLGETPAQRSEGEMQQRRICKEQPRRSRQEEPGNSGVGGRAAPRCWRAGSPLRPRPSLPPCPRAQSFQLCCVSFIFLARCSRPPRPPRRCCISANCSTRYSCPPAPPACPARPRRYSLPTRGHVLHHADAKVLVHHGVQPRHRVAQQAQQLGEGHVHAELHRLAQPQIRGQACVALRCVGGGGGGGPGRGGLAGWSSRTGGQGLAARAGACCGARRVDLLHQGLGSAAPGDPCNNALPRGGPRRPRSPAGPTCCLAEGGPMRARQARARPKAQSQPLGPLTLE